ncbi:MAG TPA: glycosyltransferase family 4 protein [Pyrinomonadaceae bacterium]|nr:glycosyltransferase family 4 protein [Pyrinomonadaceae bacterium]
MRILHINSARTFGGGERHTADLANALARRGHELFAAAPSGSPLVAELKRVPSENVFELPLRNALDVQSAIELARRVREREIEIIHAHVARDYLLAALAARRSDAPLVLTRHLERPLKSLHRWTLSGVSRVIAVSEAVERALLAQKIFPPEKIRRISNGIDLERFERRARAFDTQRFRRLSGIKGRLVVGTAGELREHKGQEDFIRAAHAVAQSFADVDFVIAGEDRSPRKEYRARLERLVLELQLQTRVHFTGWLEDVATLLPALDIFVSPSRVEPFGLVMVEAMAAGLPVVATGTGGAREIVEDGATGKLVVPEDWQGMAEAVTSLLRDEKERRRMGAAGLERARAHFSLERMVAETEALYAEVLRAE